jgi:hypothetical protein
VVVDLLLLIITKMEKLSIGEAVTIVLEEVLQEYHAGN